MRIIGLSMVKNESDIIESFVRINLRVLDALYIVDDASTDGTRGIIEALANEGLRVSVFTFPRETLGFQQQSLLMTSLLSQLLSENWDCAALLDADELILADRNDFQADVEATTRSHFGLMQWRTYVPVSENYFGSADPLHELFRPRVRERPMYKVLVPRARASNVVIRAGNHSASPAGELPSAESHRPCRTRLAHVPVRSAAQIVAKSIIGSHTLSVKKNREPGEGIHWDRFAGIIRQKHYKLTLQDIQEIAFGYLEGLQGTPADIVRELGDSPLIPSAGALKHLPEAGTLLVKAMDDFLVDLCLRYNALQGERAAG
jgi:glycosyl transferase family 2